MISSMLHEKVDKYATDFGKLILWADTVQLGG